MEDYGVRDKRYRVAPSRPQSGWPIVGAPEAEKREDESLPTVVFTILPVPNPTTADGPVLGLT